MWDSPIISISYFRIISSIDCLDKNPSLEAFTDVHIESVKLLYCTQPATGGLMVIRILVLEANCTAANEFG
jgi:hypothetical protein